MPRRLIRDLYAAHARGAPDGVLTDRVGEAMFARCQSILTVTEAAAGRVKCPQCGVIIARAGSPDDDLSCAVCGLQMAWRDYHNSYRGKQLHGGSALPAFAEFVAQWPGTRTRGEKMLLIDALLYACHGSVRFPATRPAAVNLIEGKAREIARFLDRLAGDDARP